ncbi:MAG: DUF2892 domain-containing protein [Pedosphaera sp.]|nr:DUF2892 domain-containing protein [Pedosphaera sp.]
MNQTIDVKRLHTLFASGEKPFVVDVREYPEFAAGRIPGARLIPCRKLALRRAELPVDRPIYVAGQIGGQSAKAQQRLQELGFKEVVNVEGGLGVWRAAGFGTEQDARQPWSLERQVRLTSGVMILASGLLAAFIAPELLWLAVFVGAGLTFAALTNSCMMSMLMARMPWNSPPPARSA